MCLLKRPNAVCADVLKTDKTREKIAQRKEKVSKWKERKLRCHFHVGYTSVRDRLSVFSKYVMKHEENSQTVVNGLRNFEMRRFQ